MAPSADDIDVRSKVRHGRTRLAPSSSSRRGLALDLLPVPSANQPAEEKAKRRAARALIGAYHQEQLRALLEHVRDGFAQLDAGQIDEFDLDDLIHRYKRAAADLWKFCANTGGQWLQAANTLSYLRDHGEEPDWWASSASHR